MATRGQTFLSWRISYPYPQVATPLSPASHSQNLLRNGAKAGCQTPYTFVPDIDMVQMSGALTSLTSFHCVQVPYPGLDLELEDLLAREEVTGGPG